LDYQESLQPYCFLLVLETDDQAYLEPYYIWIDHLSRTHFGVYAAPAAASASYGTAPAQLFFNHSSLYIYYRHSTKESKKEE
jgi:hypothetical protein